MNRKEEIKKRIQELEDHNFRLNLGSWDDGVGDIIRKNNSEILILKNELELLIEEELKNVGEKGSDE